MYVLKVTKDGIIVDVRHYEHFENAMGDIATDTVIKNAVGPTVAYGTPQMFCMSETDDGISDDFEFRYPCGVNIYVGKVLTEEDKKEKTKKAVTING